MDKVIPLSNAERLYLLKHVNREVMKISGTSGTVAKFEMLYRLKRKLEQRK